MDFLKYRIIAAPEWREILIAYLNEHPFQSFEETEGTLGAYLPAGADHGLAEASIRDLQKRFPFEFSVELVEDKNWNELWESKFDPIRVGQFCGVRAGFHSQVEGVAQEIIINPKMAFGTGHHATTFMMIQMMESLSFDGASVLDYGCGTGLLAILAARLGARPVLAVDIEKAACENAIENAFINEVAGGIEVRQGTLDAVKGKVFDIILANINRNVILESLPALYTQLSEAGVLLVSGILNSDVMQVAEAARAAGFMRILQVEQEEWAALKFSKS
jgi:ribosomal protein L11 methyltransferase